jgi:hypothetical protein
MIRKIVAASWGIGTHFNDLVAVAGPSVIIPVNKVQYLTYYLFFLSHTYKVLDHVFWLLPLARNRHVHKAIDSFPLQVYFPMHQPLRTCRPHYDGRSRGLLDSLYPGYALPM